jgi:hypothetical protein
MPDNSYREGFSMEFDKDMLHLGPPTSAPIPPQGLSSGRETTGTGFTASTSAPRPWWSFRAPRRRSNADVRSNLVVAADMSAAGGFRSFVATVANGEVVPISVVRRTRKPNYEVRHLRGTL